MNTSGPQDSHRMVVRARQSRSRSEKLFCSGYPTSSPDSEYTQLWYGQVRRLPVVPASSSTSAEPRCLQVL